MGVTGEDIDYVSVYSIDNSNNNNNELVFSHKISIIEGTLCLHKSSYVSTVIDSITVLQIFPFL